MKEYQTGQIRNIALISHNGAGKTTLVERLLFNTGATTRMGSVQQATAVMDFEEEEMSRNSSVSTSLAPIIWKDQKLNILDTPGYLDFIGEVNSALKVVDGVAVLVEAVSGVEVGTEIVWQAAKRQNKSRLMVINKMDRDNVRIKRVMKSIEDNLDGRFVNLQLPIGEGPRFKGVVDLLLMKARIGDNDEIQDIPADMVEAANAARVTLVEAAAEGDNVLIEKYFEEFTLTNNEIIIGLKGAMRQGLLTPIVYSAPEPGIAVAPLLDIFNRLMLAPNEAEPFQATNAAGEEQSYENSDTSPLAAFIFKTREDPYGRTSYLRVFGGILESDSRVWDNSLDSEVRIGTLQVVTGNETSAVTKLHSGDIGSIVKLNESSTNATLCDRGHTLTIAPIKQPGPISSVAIFPESQADVAKLNQSLAKLVGEDPTLVWKMERATNQTILSGMGTTHLDIAVKKAKSKFGVNLNTEMPKVPYRETITKTNSAEYTHKKQSGGAGQYARVFIRVESADDNLEFEFDSEIYGGSISASFVSATEKGCRQALEGGVLAGYPVVGVKAVVYDGKEHPVDSKEIAFQTAGREGFKRAVMGADPVLLEPIYGLSVTVPSDNMGDILGDLNTRRASVQGMDQAGTKSIIRAEVPLAEVQRYAADLRSITQGRGVFSMEFLRYGRVPAFLLDDLVAKLRAEEADSVH